MLPSGPAPTPWESVGAAKKADAPMNRLATRTDAHSDQFARNAARMRPLVGELREKLARVREGGGPDAVARHHRRGKLTARQRIDRLADPLSPFLEFSA